MAGLASFMKTSIYIGRAILMMMIRIGNKLFFRSALRVRIFIHIILQLFLWQHNATTSLNKYCPYRFQLIFCSCNNSVVTTTTTCNRRIHD